MTNPQPQSSPPLPPTDPDEQQPPAPKFALGQRLWPIMRPVDLYVVFPPFDFTVYRRRWTGDVLYGFNQDYGFLECDVFADAASAQAECDRRNVPTPTTGEEEQR